MWLGCRGRVRGDRRQNFTPDVAARFRWAAAVWFEETAGGTLSLRWLLDVVGLPQQDLFQTREQLIAEALALQEARIAYVYDRQEMPAEEKRS